ncbi:hypothetical protein ACIA5D_27775 [Actinoplanes sp. NPDC051513]|uniref:hypothetical protein n=1 Tax=Actinoplanes sp. NPDC051513 TaxID=3363908 RepID=UPI0037AB4F8A
MRITPIGPRNDNTHFSFGGDYQSVSGKQLCIACSPDGGRAYLGGQAGVWRSRDGGLHWNHLEWAQPPQDRPRPPGALPVTNVYDLWVHPDRPDVVLAATGRDFRRPEAGGVYRSTDAGETWALVHQFLDGAGNPTMACTFGGAPDDPELVFAGGSGGLAASADGGRTWRAVAVAPSAAVNHVLVGAAAGGTRHVYASGSAFWHSADGGVTWRADPGGPAIGPPTDGVGESSRATCLHPGSPRIVYARRVVPAGDTNVEELLKGDFPAGDGAGSWTRLPNPPIGYAGTTASGASFVLAHRAPDGQLLLVVSDRRTTHLAVGEPNEVTDWIRIDGDPVHVDPHGLAASRDLRRSPAPSMGRLFLVSDGGAYVSTDGARSWTQGRGLSTLGLVNAAVLSVDGRPRGICLQSGDNSGFYSRDGGTTWATQDYVGGDNDCTFADPRQPSRLVVFAPRAGNREIFLYTGPGGAVPDAARGTTQRHRVKGPPLEDGQDNALWNAVSGFYFAGYRPLVLTRADEQPLPDGDFVVIWTQLAADRAQLLRTTKLSSLTASDDWVTAAVADGPGVKVFRQGPPLPVTVDVVQPSGGHARPTFTVAESRGSRRAFRWRSGMASWATLVPSAGAGPRQAVRFFADPYRPDLVYVLDTDHVWRTDDGGGHWVVDAGLERVLTLDAFSFAQRGSGALLRDMAFDPRLDVRFAAGPRGVFHTADGANWRHLALSSALGAQVNGLFYDPGVTPCDRSLYASTTARGLLRLHPLPPEWDTPLGSVNAATGHLTELRVHELGSGFGPPTDRLDAEVVVQLDAEPGKAFGFPLRTGNGEAQAGGMLDLLRDVFRTGRRVRLEYVRTGCRIGTLIRVVEPD